MNKVITFFQEVKAELDKVTWPKWDDLVGTVIIVCILSFFFAIVIGLMDAAFTYIIKWIIS